VTSFSLPPDTVLFFGSDVRNPAKGTLLLQRSIRPTTARHSAVFRAVVFQILYEILPMRKHPMQQTFNLRLPTTRNAMKIEESAF
jgi:hypothetical protein